MQPARPQPKPPGGQPLRPAPPSGSQASTTLDAALDLSELRFEPSAAVWGTAADAETYREAFLNDLGIAWDTYKGFVSVANSKGCLILIRKTNQGVIYGFTQGNNVTGKTLATKLKSSEYPPIRSNLAFFTFLSKKAVEDLFKTPFDASAYWDNLSHEQEKLLKVVEGPEAAMHKVKEHQLPDQTFVPKLLPWSRLKDLLGPVADAPRAWFVQQVTVSKPPQGPVQYTSTTWAPPLAAPEPAADSTKLVQFLWLNVGRFKQANDQFCARFNADMSIAPPLKVSLVCDQSHPDDEYYKLYIQAPAEAAPKEKQRRFAMELEPAPAGAAGGKWLAVSVLAQYKVAQGEPADDPHISYYEIVADYDVFAIAPPLKEVTAYVMAASARSGAKVDHYFPKFSPARGLVSEYERRIRTSLNQSMSGVDWINNLFDGVAESVLHGCEVNNYFFTETFGPLILVPPGVWKVKKVVKGAGSRAVTVDDPACPRFNFSTQAFLDLCRCKVDLPEQKLGDKTWPKWEIAGSSLAWQWLIHLNLMWPHGADGLTTVESFEALLNDVYQTFQREPKSVNHQAVRLWYYGGIYRYAFLEMGKAFDHLASHLELSHDLKVKQALAKKLHEIRTNLKNAIDTIVSSANSLRATLAGGGRNVDCYAAALQALDSRRVTGDDAMTSLRQYVNGPSELWKAWLTMPRGVTLPGDLKELIRRKMPDGFELRHAMEQEAILAGTGSALADVLQAAQEKLDPIDDERSSKRRLERHYLILLLWQKEAEQVMRRSKLHKAGFGHEELVGACTHGEEGGMVARPSSVLAGGPRPQKARPKPLAHTV